MTGELCDVCAEKGLAVPAVEDMQLPGGAWAFVCAADAYRVRSRRGLSEASTSGKAPTVEIPRRSTDGEIGGTSDKAYGA